MAHLFPDFQICLGAANQMPNGDLAILLIPPIVLIVTCDMYQLQMIWREFPKNPNWPNVDREGLGSIVVISQLLHHLQPLVVSLLLLGVLTVVTYLCSQRVQLNASMASTISTRLDVGCPRLAVAQALVHPLWEWLVHEEDNAAPSSGCPPYTRSFAQLSAVGIWG